MYGPRSVTTTITLLPPYDTASRVPNGRILLAHVSSVSWNGRLDADAVEFGGELSALP